MTHAQAGQDLWVVEMLKGRRDGFYVDIGAHDGLVHSNTLLLERDYGWNGVCVEPQDVPFEQLAAARRAACVQTAVLDYDGAVAFMNDHVSSSGTIVPCMTLTTVLEAVDAPRTIDYLSIDVEGSELEVLNGLDFNAYTVNLITIEHNLYLRGPEHKDAIYSLLTALDFERVCEDVVAPGYGAYEDWFRNSALR